MEAMKSIALIAGLIAVCHCLPNVKSFGVEQMEIVQEVVEVVEEDVSHHHHDYDDTKTYGYEHRLVKYLRDNFMTGQKQISKVETFNWKNCGNGSTELLKINGLSFTPDPLKIPGPLIVKFDADISANVASPLKVLLELKKKVGSIWIKIPCIDGIGSCTYDDLCDKLKNAVCPPPFVSKHIPCKCPFPQGNYSLPSTTFNITLDQVPDGDYSARAQLTYNSKPVYCIELNFTLA